MPVWTLNEAKVQIWADDGDGNVVGDDPLYSECYAQAVTIRGTLEALKRNCTGRRNPKIHTRARSYTVHFSEFYYSRDLQLALDDIYAREVRLQFWLLLDDVLRRERHIVKTAVITDFELGANDNDTFLLTLDLTAEDYRNDNGS